MGMNMITQHKLMASAASVALCLFVGAPAYAADEQDQKAVSELVVTGDKPVGLEAPADAGALGDKSILDTPFSVTVISAAEIAERQPASMAQLFIKDPAIFSFATAGTVNWWGTQIRGLGVRNYYVDDLPIPLYWGGDFPLEPIESVQALKGATGFMYGFGAPGGAILYRTKRPTAMQTLSTEAGWRGHSVFSAGVDVGGPAGPVEGLGYRLNLAGASGEEYNEARIDRGIGALAVDYRITPKLSLRLNTAYEDYEITGEPFHLYWTLPSGAALPRVPTNYDYLNVDNSTYRYTTLTAGGDLTWQMNDGWKVNAAGGYTRKRHFSNKMFIELFDTSGDYDAYHYQFGEIDQAKFGQVLVQGQLTTGAIRHDIVAGLSSQLVQSDFGFNAYAYEFSGNIFAPNNYLLPGAPNFNAYGSPFQERQAAIFLSDTLYFGDHWQVLAGVRNTAYDLDDLDSDPLTVHYATEALTPTFAVIYKPVQNATIYASYVESLEGGTVVTDPVMYSNIGEILPAAVSQQYEAGFKYDGARWSLTAAAFRIKQAARIDVDVGLALPALRQDGLTVYDGFEISGEYRLTERLTIGGGAVILDAAYEQTSDPTLIGTIPPEVAKHQVVGNVEYDVAAVPGLKIHATARYFGEAPTYNPDNLIPGYTLVSAGANYTRTIGGRDVVFTANVNNLFNKKYWGLENFGEGINGALGVKLAW